MHLDKALETALRAREHAYAWFHLALGEHPAPESLKWLASDESREVLALFERAGQPAYTELLANVGQDLATFRERPGDALERLGRDYTRLFIGPETLPLKHWESVFRKNDAVLFQESTLEVRKAYLSEEVLPSEYPHVADDHVAIELDFMAYLAHGVCDSLRACNVEAAVRQLEKSRCFLEEHLLKWIPKYAQGAARLKGTYRFYPESIMLLEEFLISDSAAIDEIGKAIDPQWTSQRGNRIN